MPPKKKAGGKKSAKEKTPVLIDGLTKQDISEEQLERHIKRLTKEKHTEYETGNPFRLERDRIRDFWQIIIRKLDEAKAELKNLDEDIEEDERRHQVMIKQYLPQMKFLRHEHQNTIAELKAKRLDSTQAVQEEQDQQETELLHGMRAVMVDIQELDNENLIETLEKKHDEKMTLQRKSWEKKLAEIQANYDKKTNVMLNHLMRNVTIEREDDWNCYMNTLTENHNRAINDTKAQVVRMQQDQDINNALKAQYAEFEKENMEKKKELKCVLEDNKHLTELFSKVKEEHVKMEDKIEYYVSKKDAAEIVSTKELDDLKCDNEMLEQKLSKLQLKRDELHQTFHQRIQELQQKMTLKSRTLERKLKDLTDNLEEMQAQFCSVLSASNIDRIALHETINNTEQQLDSSNTLIKDLEYKKAQISEAHMDLLLPYEAKLRALGVPVEELWDRQSPGLE